jgi:hypothetical protein
MRFIFGVFPLLAVPVIIYNLMALAFGGGPDGTMTMTENLNRPFASIGMVADGAVWDISSGAVLILLALVFFFVEILKSTDTGSSSIVNHATSMLVFVVTLIEFLLLKNFATSVFFVMMTMCLLDVLAGVVVTIKAARRDFSVGGHGAD